MRLIDKALIISDENEDEIIENSCPITLFGVDAVDRHFDVDNCENANCEGCWEQQWKE
jgi:hypothetical protein